jgi:guanylate kinase
MEEFEKMIEEKAFVENAKFGGNRYGTSKRTIGELTASGKVVVLDIEMEVCPPFIDILSAFFSRALGVNF